MLWSVDYYPLDFLDVIIMLKWHIILMSFFTNFKLYVQSLSTFKSSHELLRITIVIRDTRHFIDSIVDFACYSFEYWFERISSVVDSTIMVSVSIASDTHFST